MERAEEPVAPPRPLLMFVTGGVGTGNSFLIAAVRPLIVRSDRGSTASLAALLLHKVAMFADELNDHLL